MPITLLVESILKMVEEMLDWVLITFLRAIRIIRHLTMAELKKDFRHLTIMVIKASKLPITMVKEANRPQITMETWVFKLPTMVATSLNMTMKESKLQITTSSL